MSDLIIDITVFLLTHDMCLVLFLGFIGILFMFAGCALGMVEGACNV